MKIQLVDTLTREFTDTLKRWSADVEEAAAWELTAEAHEAEEVAWKATTEVFATMAKEPEEVEIKRDLVPFGRASAAVCRENALAARDKASEARKGRLFKVKCRKRARAVKRVWEADGMARQMQMVQKVFLAQRRATEPLWVDAIAALGKGVAAWEAAREAWMMVACMKWEEGKDGAEA